MTLKWMLCAIACALHFNAYPADAEIRLATFEYPPYITQSGGTESGLTVDIVREAFSRMGKTLVIEFYPFARAQNMVISGDVDGMFSLKRKAEREDTMLFPKKSLMSQDYVFFVLKGTSTAFDGDFSSLTQASIGIVNATGYGTRFDDAAKAGVFKKLDMANSYELNFKKLLAGRVDAVISSRVVGLNILKNMNALSQVDVSGPSVEIANSYLAFTRVRNFTDVAAKFDKAMQAMEKDGTIKKLQKSYSLVSP